MFKKGDAMSNIDKLKTGFSKWKQDYQKKKENKKLRANDAKSRFVIGFMSLIFRSYGQKKFKTIWKTSKADPARKETYAD